MSPLGGTAVAFTLGDGREVVAKRGAGPGAAPAEATGLRWLGAPGDVAVPLVHGYDEDWLVTDLVRPGSPGIPAAEAFGRGLAALHLRGAPAFGCPPPGGPAGAWIGLAPMRNEPHGDWPSFYAARRVRPYVRTAVGMGLFDGGQAAEFDRLCERLPDAAGADEPPARLHGDAWNGNVLWGAGERVWLIDPAAHGGHREADLAMLRLFGLPLLDVVLDAYAGAAADAGSPLADGWRERAGLHQLYPLLVHTVLFGGSYPERALAAARGAVR
nr:fructosamine kinase family protein [Amycolatopsis antarctica]